MSRPTSCPGLRSALPLTSARLRTLAQRLASAAIPGPHLVHVRGDDAGVQLSILALDELQPEAQHPLDALVGFRAPAAWQALGIVAPGTTHHLARGSSGADDVTRGRVRVALLVARNGEQASALAGVDHLSLPPLGNEPVEGLLNDALHRCLTLPTAPPSWPPSRWLTCRWLDQLTLQAAATRGAPSVRTKARALANHPLATNADAKARVASALHDRLRLIDDAGWEGLRHAAAAEPAAAQPLRTAAELISPTLARWADAGSLARLLEAELPPAAFLFDAARAILPPPVAAAVLLVASPWLP